MPKHKPAPETTNQRLARQIIDSALKIQLAGKWQHVEDQTIKIQRAARQLLLDAPVITAEPEQEETLESAIASSYIRAAERQVEGAAATIALIDNEELSRPETVGLCLLMLNIATATIHKYLRAACAAENQPPRPLDIDGDRGDQIEEEAA